MYRFTLSGFYLFLDCVCIFFSVLLAYGTYHFFNLGREVTYEFSTLISFSLALAFVGCVILFIFGAYRRESGILNVLEVKNVILGILTCFAITNTFFFALNSLRRVTLWFSLFYSCSSWSPWHDPLPIRPWLLVCPKYFNAAS